MRYGRAVIREIAATLDASLQRCESGESAGPRLTQVRNTLTCYSKAVHTPFGALGVSPYRAYGELASVLAAPKVPLAANIESITYDQLQSVLRDLDDLAAQAKAIEDVASHPWRDCTRTFLSEEDTENLAALLVASAKSLEVLVECVSFAEEQLGLPPLTNF